MAISSSSSFFSSFSFLLKKKALQPRRFFRSLAVCFAIGFLLTLLPSSRGHSSFAMASSLATSCSRLKEGGIIPDVLPSEKDCANLSVSVEIHFPGGIARDGQEWTLSETRHCPLLKFSKPPPHGEVFYVFLTDPDAPKRSDPVAAEWAHWVAATDDRTLGESSKTFLEYAGPTPPAGTGLHRYVLLVYAGKAGELQGVPSPSNRRQWGGKKKAHTVAKVENGLTLVGVDWFTVQRV